MTINPIIPIWLMAIICIVLILFKRKRTLAYIRQIVVIILVFVMNLRIMIPFDTVKEIDMTMDAKVLFVIDNTLSMIANDYDGEERISAVKRDCEYIIDKLAGAKYSVVSFENVSNVLSPYTDNTEYIKNVINSIKPLDSYYARGTSLDVALESMPEILKGQYEEDKQTILFFISDGEMTLSGSGATFKGVSDYVTNGAVLGYGTSDGGNMYVTEYGEREPLIDYDTNEPAISVLDEDNLKKIAKDVEIDYIHMTKQSDIDNKIDEILKNINIEETPKTTKGYTDIYYYFSIPIILIMFYEFVKLRK